MGRVLCEARTEAGLASRDQCSLEMFSTYHWQVNINMAGPASLFGGGQEVIILLSTSRDLQVGQRIQVTGRLRTGDLTVPMIDSVTSINVIS